jgi:hypothetical protein
MAAMADVTQILAEAEAGDPHAAAELRKLAPGRGPNRFWLE